MAFDFASQFMVSTSTDIIVSAEPFTISLWFNGDSGTGSTQTLYSVADSSGTSQEHAVYVTSNNVRCFSRDGFTFIAQSTGTYTDGVWTHAAARFISDGSRKVYRDGSNEGTNADSATVTGLDETRLGERARSTGGNHFNGKICEVAIWDSDIGTDAIASLAKGFSPLFFDPSNLLDYWGLVRSLNGIKGNNWTNGSATVFQHFPGIIYPATPHIGIAPFVAPPAGGPSLVELERHYPRGAMRGVLRGAA